MKREELNSKVVAILHECLMDDEIAINEGANLADDLGLDSMGFVDLTVKIEEEFDIEVSETEGAAIKTYDDVVNLVIAKLSEQNIEID